MEVEKLAIPIEKQVKLLQRGTQYLKLARAATLNDGIISINESELNKLVESFDLFKGTMTKFVPASGAASRMFKHAHNLDSSEGLCPRIH